MDGSSTWRYTQSIDKLCKQRCIFMKVIKRAVAVSNLDLVFSMCLKVQGRIEGDTKNF